MIQPGEYVETSAGGQKGLGDNAAAMANLAMGIEERIAPNQPTVGEFYTGLANEIGNETLKQLLAKVSERRLESRRMWPGQDEAPGSNGYARMTENNARGIITSVVKDADIWLTRPDSLDSGTLLELADIELIDGELTDSNKFDHALLAQLQSLFDMHDASDQIPQLGEHAQPKRFETVFYKTNLPGVQVAALKHRPDGQDLRHDGTDSIKYSLVR